MHSVLLDDECCRKITARQRVGELRGKELITMLIKVITVALQDKKVTLEKDF